jgi:hypothetical protein
MLTRELEELKAYREKLRNYSTEELEDIYFHIHILRQPLRYRVLMMELEQRRLQPPTAPPSALEMTGRLNLRAWAETHPRLREYPALRSVLLAILFCILTAGVTLLLLLPIWLFAIPLHFIGIQTALVYFACAPVPPILAAGFGGRIGGRGWYGIWVLLGVVIGLWLFNATGAPAAILQSVVKPQPAGGGFGFGGF